MWLWAHMYYAFKFYYVHRIKLVISSAVEHIMWRNTFHSFLAANNILDSLYKPACGLHRIRSTCHLHLHIISFFFFHTLKSKLLVERGKQNCRFTFSKPACRNEIVDIAGNFHKEYKVGLYVPDLDQKVIIHGVVEKRSP